MFRSFLQPFGFGRENNSSKNPGSQNPLDSLSLTRAVYSRDEKTLQEGFRCSSYIDESDNEIQLTEAAVSTEKLVDVFGALLNLMPEELDVVLESSHADINNCTSSFGRVADDIILRRESIDRCVLESYLVEFEDLLLNDGATGIAVISDEDPLEIHFDIHKSIYIYSNIQDPFRSTLRQFGIEEKPKLCLINDGSHNHRSAPKYQLQFTALSKILEAEPENDDDIEPESFETGV